MLTLYPYILKSGEPNGPRSASSRTFGRAAFLGVGPHGGGSRPAPVASESESARACETGESGKQTPLFSVLSGRRARSSLRTGAAAHAKQGIHAPPHSSGKRAPRRPQPASFFFGVGARQCLRCSPAQRLSKPRERRRLGCEERPDRVCRQCLFDSCCWREPRLLVFSAATNTTNKDWIGLLRLLLSKARLSTAMTVSASGRDTHRAIPPCLSLSLSLSLARSLRTGRTAHAFFYSCEAVASPHTSSLPPPGAGGVTGRAKTWRWRVALLAVIIISHPRRGSAPSAR